MAEALAAAGADIIGVSASLESEGSAVEAAVRAHGRSFRGVACDFGDPEAVAALGSGLVADGTIDILVNNAGTIYREPAIDHDLAEWSRILTVNLTSQFALTQAVARPMLDRGWGRVIVTASLLSFQGGINVPGYTSFPHTSPGHRGWGGRRATRERHVASSPSGRPSGAAPRWKAQAAGTLSNTTVSAYVCPALRWPKSLPASLVTGTMKPYLALTLACTSSKADGSYLAGSVVSASTGKEMGSFDAWADNGWTLFTTALPSGSYYLTGDLIDAAGNTTKVWYNGATTAGGATPLSVVAPTDLVGVTFRLP